MHASHGGAFRPPAPTWLPPVRLGGADADAGTGGGSIREVDAGGGMADEDVAGPRRGFFAVRGGALVLGSCLLALWRSTKACFDCLWSCVGLGCSGRVLNAMPSGTSSLSLSLSDMCAFAAYIALRLPTRLFSVLLSSG